MLNNELLRISQKPEIEVKIIAYEDIQYPGSGI
jgi:hypothetical protein